MEAYTDHAQKKTVKEGKKGVIFHAHGQATDTHTWKRTFMLMETNIYNTYKILLNINSTLLDLYGVTVFLAVNDPIFYMEYVIQGIHVALEETKMLRHQNNLF